VVVVLLLLLLQVPEQLLSVGRISAAAPMKGLIFVGMEMNGTGWFGAPLEAAPVYVCTIQAKQEFALLGSSDGSTEHHSCQDAQPVCACTLPMN